MNPDYQRYIREWDPDFRARSPNYGQGPIQNRSCKDICCLITFFIILGSFLLLGFSSISHGASDWQKHPPILRRDGQAVGDITASFSDLSLHSGQIFTIIILMAVFSFIVLIAYLFLLKAFPRCMIYTSMIISGLFLILVAIIAFAAGHIIIGVVTLILLAIYGIVLCCCMRDSIEATIIMVRLTAEFLSNNCSVFLTPIAVGLVGLFLALFAVASIGGISKETALGKVNDGGVAGYSVLHLLFYFFFMYFLYYVMVFLIATAAGDWYFQRPSGCCSGVGKLVRGHIGSLTFASIIITLVKIIQYAVDTAARQADNLCAVCCLCLVKCFLSMLQGLVHTLNHFAIIVMSYTGQGFVQSAKTAGVVIFSNINLFAVLSSVSSLIFFTGIIFTTLIPTLVSIPVAQAFGIHHDASVIAVIVFMVSLLMSCIFLCALSESLMSIYVFYCFDRQLQQYGVRSVPLQQQIIGYDQIVFNDLSGYPPNQLLASAHPLLIGQEQQAPSNHSPPPPPTSNLYPVPPPIQPPIQPLYQPYNSGIKTNYDTRNYNDASKFQRGSQPTSNGAYPDF